MDFGQNSCVIITMGNPDVIIVTFYDRNYEKTIN